MSVCTIFSGLYTSFHDSVLSLFTVCLYHSVTVLAVSWLFNKNLCTTFRTMLIMSDNTFFALYYSCLCNLSGFCTSFHDSIIILFVSAFCIVVLCFYLRLLAPSMVCTNYSALHSLVVSVLWTAYLSFCISYLESYEYLDLLLVYRFAELC